MSTQPEGRWRKDFTVRGISRLIRQLTLVSVDDYDVLRASISATRKKSVTSSVQNCVVKDTRRKDVVGLSSSSTAITGAGPFD